MTDFIDLVLVGFFSGIGNAIAYYLITEHLLRKMNVLGKTNDYSKRLRQTRNLGFQIKRVLNLY